MIVRQERRVPDIFQTPVCQRQTRPNHVVFNWYVWVIHPSISPQTELLVVIEWAVVDTVLVSIQESVTDTRSLPFNQYARLIKIWLVAYLESKQGVPENRLALLNDFHVDVDCVVEWHTEEPLDIH